MAMSKCRVLCLATEFKVLLSSEAVVLQVDGRVHWCALCLRLLGWGWHCLFLGTVTMTMIVTVAVAMAVLLTMMAVRMMMMVVGGLHRLPMRARWQMSIIVVQVPLRYSLLKFE